MSDPSELLAELVDQCDAIKAATYRHEFSKALCRATSVIEFDAERVAELADRELLDKLGDARDSLVRFTAQVEANFKPVRRIK